VRPKEPVRLLWGLVLSGRDRHSVRGPDLPSRRVPGGPLPPASPGLQRYRTHRKFKPLSPACCSGAWLRHTSEESLLTGPLCAGLAMLTRAIAIRCPSTLQCQTGRHAARSRLCEDTARFLWPYGWLWTRLQAVWFSITFSLQQAARGDMAPLCSRAGRRRAENEHPQPKGEAPQHRGDPNQQCRPHRHLPLSAKPLRLSGRLVEPAGCPPR
jgi:hypothetical protein